MNPIYDVEWKSGPLSEEDKVDFKPFKYVRLHVGLGIAKPCEIYCLNKNIFHKLLKAWNSSGEVWLYWEMKNE